MKEVVVRRCPACPIIQRLIEQLIEELVFEPDVCVWVVEGSKGELTITLDGINIPAKIGHAYRPADDLAFEITESRQDWVDA